ncbi:hypothetical protein KAI04_00815 [Candidatus Pacearchaeota archaeon]|nr:hypothetical protein [Candidatus Pacearchaeota archaeon]
MRKVNSYDLLGSVAIVRFPLDFKKIEKKKFAEYLLKKQKAIKTVLEKKGKIKGRLRKISTIYLAGEKTKEVLYRENNCSFRFQIDNTYFSPRLSNERKEIAEQIKKGDEVLVMFAGVAPLPIVIAKNSKAKKIVSNEINREANKYAQLNIELNKVKDRVELLFGDIKRVAEKTNKKFDVIAMPRPQLKDTFLKQAFKLSKKNTRIFYYDFCEVTEKDKIVEKIKEEAKKARKKIKILKVKSAGEIAPYKLRVRVDFKIV